MNSRADLAAKESNLRIIKARMGGRKGKEATTVTCTKEALEIEVARQKSAIKNLETSLDALQQKNKT